MVFKRRKRVLSLAIRLFSMFFLFSIVLSKRKTLYRVRKFRVSFSKNEIQVCEEASSLEQAHKSDLLSSYLRDLLCSCLIC